MLSAGLVAGVDSVIAGGVAAAGVESGRLDGAESDAGVERGALSTAGAGLGSAALLCRGLDAGALAGASLLGLVFREGAFAEDELSGGALWRVGALWLDGALS